jgi:hypothetical protein
VSSSKPVINFEKILVSEYLKYGSIDKVFSKHHQSLPISFAGYARLLSKYGVVKSAGPNSKFSESLYLLSLLANYKIPMERIYHKHAPHSLQVSTNTLHRILHYMRLGLTRRQGAILVITSQDEPDKVLIGNDDSLSGKSITGKRGDLTLPMGHSKVGESIRDSIARILQNEVFSFAVVEEKFPWQYIPEHIKPIMNVNLADIFVSVYKLELPQKHIKFSSFKLHHLKFVRIEDIDYTHARPGVKDVLDAYRELQNANSFTDIPTINSELNSKIYALAKEPAK